MSNRNPVGGVSQSQAARQRAAIERARLELVKWAGLPESPIRNAVVRHLLSALTDRPELLACGAISNPGGRPAWIW